MSTEILDAVSRAVWVAGCCDDATYDEAVAAAKRGSPADASALLFNQEVAKAAISAMQSEISAERDAAVALAEQAEAHLAEVERLRDRVQTLGTEGHAYHAGRIAAAEMWHAERDALKAEVELLRAALGAEQDSADEMADVLSACGDGLMFDVDRLQAALDHHDALREAAIRTIPMPTDAAAALGRVTAQARAQGLREAAVIAAHRYAVCDDAYLKRLGEDFAYRALEAKHIEDEIRARAEEIEKEARNG